MAVKKDKWFKVRIFKDEFSVATEEVKARSPEGAARAVRKMAREGRLEFTRTHFTYETETEDLD